MARAHITKVFYFEAAHQLPNHDGKCSRLHGHNYQVEITASGPVRDLDGTSSEGMVLDFGWLSDFWKKECEPVLDHRFLNEVLSVPTAERVAAWIMRAFQRSPWPAMISTVRVWETPDASAIVTQFDMDDDGDEDATKREDFAHDERRSTDSGAVRVGDAEAGTTGGAFRTGDY